MVMEFCETVGIVGYLSSRVLRCCNSVHQVYDSLAGLMQCANNLKITLFYERFNLFSGLIFVLRNLKRMI